MDRRHEWVNLYKTTCARFLQPYNKQISDHSVNTGVFLY